MHLKFAQTYQKFVQDSLEICPFVFCTKVQNQVLNLSLLKFSQMMQLKFSQMMQRRATRIFQRMWYNYIMVQYGK